MDWYQHPRFIRVRDEVVDDLRREVYHFRKIGKVVLLCGGKQSSRRDRLKEYLGARRSDCLVFYAESAWSVIARNVSGENALKAEERLAGLADIVALVVESAGTFAELGAFAISPDLRKKLFPILDRRYQEDDSFVKTGPVAWVDTDSFFSPSIWVHQGRILEAAGEIEERLDRIPETKVQDINIVESPKHRLFFVCDLVSIFGPCPSEHIAHISEQLLGVGFDDIDLMLALGNALEILSTFRFDGREMFYRGLEAGRLPSFHHTKKYVSIPDLRARVLSVLQVCEESREVLAKLQAVSNAS